MTDYTLVPLTETVALNEIDALLRIEQAVRKQSGDVYSPEEWGREQFLLSVPGKWNYSCIAHAGASTCGFFIVSVRSEPSVYAHPHRMAVEPSHQGRGLAVQMFDWLEERLRADGIRRVVYSVAEANVNARRLYERLGYRKTEGDTLASLLPTHVPNLTVGPDYYRIGESTRNCIYLKTLGAIKTV